MIGETIAIAPSREGGNKKNFFGRLHATSENEISAMHGRAELTFSSGHQNLIKTFHNEAITKFTLIFFLTFTVTVDFGKTTIICRHLKSIYYVKNQLNISSGFSLKIFVISARRE